jgi:hypothetical protein
VDDRYVFHRKRGESFEAVDLFQFFLDLVGDVELDVLRRRAGVTRGDHHLGEIDARKFVALDKRQRTEAEQDDHQREYVGQRVAAGEIT